AREAAYPIDVARSRARPALAAQDGPIKDRPAVVAHEAAAPSVALPASRLEVPRMRAHRSDRRGRVVAAVGAPIPRAPGRQLQVAEVFEQRLEADEAHR